MKSMLNLLVPIIAAVALSLSSVTAFAHEKREAGPNGGRILTKVTPPAEFFVTKDRRIQITFLDKKGRPVAPAGQTVTVTTGSRAAPTVMTFNRQEGVLLSETALPDGNNLPAVVQIRPAPDADEVVVKFNVNLSTCSECRHAEYACICGH